MLYQIMKEIRNFFPTKVSKTDSFTIEGGTTSLDFITEGQYFIVEGSNFNDNRVFVYPATDMQDETFVGTITVLAPPKEFIELAKEIEDFVANDKPTGLISESFGGYSYSRAVDSNGNFAGWQSAFATRLKGWRKI